MKIKIQGTASGKDQTITAQVTDFELTVMNFLRSKGYPIASSCYGEGVCQKCELIINNQVIKSCQLLVSSLIINELNIIEISYL